MYVYSGHSAQRASNEPSRSSLRLAPSWPSGRRRLMPRTRAPGDGAGRERTICPSSSLYTRGGESVVVPPAGRPTGVTRDEACEVDLGGAGRVDAAERGCVGSEDAGDAPLVRDAVQVVSVTWLGMAGLVGLGAAAVIT